MRKEVMGTILLSFPAYKSGLGKKRIITRFLKHFTECNKQINKTFSLSFVLGYYKYARDRSIRTDLK